MRFWAENAKNKCKGNKQKQIPDSTSLRAGFSGRQQERQMEDRCARVRERSYWLIRGVCVAFFGIYGGG
jgi:hypothetical protein